LVFSSDGVSRLGLGLVASLRLEGFRSRLGLEGCRSRSRLYILQRNDLAKISTIQRFFVGCICR